MKNKILKIISFILGVLILVSVILKFALWPYYINNFPEPYSVRTQSVWLQALYFTNISNILVGLFFICYSLGICKKIIQNNLVELALSSYILITLIVYFTGVLFANRMWCGFVLFDVISVFLHLITPCAFLVIYFLKPKTRVLYFCDALKVLIFPTIYALVVSVVGNALMWFPYFFFNPYKLALVFNLNYSSSLGAAGAVSVAGCSVLSMFFLVEIVLIGLNNYVFVEPQYINQITHKK